MDCRDAREQILDSLTLTREARNTAEFEHHLACCEACRSFRELHLELDRQLTSAIPPPQLRSQFRRSVMARLRRDRFDFWFDSMPDIAHLAGCTCATAASVWLLPFSAVSTLSAGLAFTLASYVLQCIVRGSIEAWEEP